MTHHYYQTKSNGLSELLAAQPIARRLEQIQLCDMVLVEIDDDPFGPPLKLGVFFIEINLNSLELTLGGYPYDEGNNRFDTTKYTAVPCSPNGFRRVIKEEV